MSSSSHQEKDSASVADEVKVNTQEGVRKVEVIQKVWTTPLKILLYIGIALARSVSTFFSCADLLFPDLPLLIQLHVHCKSTSEGILLGLEL